MFEKIKNVNCLSFISMLLSLIMISLALYFVDNFYVFSLMWIVLLLMSFCHKAYGLRIFVVLLGVVIGYSIFNKSLFYYAKLIYLALYLVLFYLIERESMELFFDKIFYKPISKKKLNIYYKSIYMPIIRERNIFKLDNFVGSFLSNKKDRYYLKLRGCLENKNKRDLHGFSVSNYLRFFNMPHIKKFEFKGWSEIDNTVILAHAVVLVLAFFYRW